MFCYCSASRLQEYSLYSRIAVPIIVILLTPKGLDAIHIVDNTFLYNVPCVDNEKVATGLRNGLPYSPIAAFSDITSSRNIFCTPGPLHNARSTKTYMNRLIDCEVSLQESCLHVWMQVRQSHYFTEVN